MQKGCIIQAIYQTAAGLLLFFYWKANAACYTCGKRRYWTAAADEWTPGLDYAEKYFFKKDMLQKSLNLRL